MATSRTTVLGLWPPPAHPAGATGYAQATYTVQSAELTDQARDALAAVVDQARAGA